MLLNAIYYFLKPLIPRRLQIALRRTIVRRKRSPKGQEKCRDLIKLEEGFGFRPSFKFVPKRAVRINHYLKEWESVGFRSAVMCHNLTWVHDLNIEYDSSTFDTDPFEPQPDGVRTIFPFWVPGNAAPNRYVELHILLQDFMLFVLIRSIPSVQYYVEFLECQYRHVLPKDMAQFWKSLATHSCELLKVLSFRQRK